MIDNLMQNSTSKRNERKILHRLLLNSENEIVIHDKQWFVIYFLLGMDSVQSKILSAYSEGDIIQRGAENSVA